MTTATPFRTIITRTTALGAAVGAAALLALAGGHGVESHQGMRMCPMSSTSLIPIGGLPTCKPLPR